MQLFYKAQVLSAMLLYNNFFLGGDNIFNPFVTFFFFSFKGVSYGDEIL